MSQGTSIQATPNGGQTINASVQLTSVAASIQNAGVSASVNQAAAISASVFGGAGTQIQNGIATLAQAADVAISNATDGDVLRFSQMRWRNHPELQLTDGGNF